MEIMTKIKNKELDELLAKFENAVKRFDELPHNPKGLNEPISYILSLGGKRVRPLLVLLACDIYKGDIEDAINPALAIELFHNFTLMHDDIMDEAPLRRGFPTVHSKYNVNTAILSGDVMLIYAYQLLETLDGDVFKQIFKVFNDAAIKVCEGQQFDMNYEEEDGVSISSYINMIELKTAVLLGCSLQVGAIVGGANKSDVSKLYEFGKNIGIAFQLQDDTLDTFGDSATFGKQIGGDILQNKKTYLLLTAMKLANESDLKELHAWLKKKDYKPEEKISAVTNIYKKYDILEKANQEKRKYTDIAFDYLNQLQLTESQKEPLVKIANRLLKRKQ